MVFLVCPSEGLRWQREIARVQSFGGMMGTWLLPLILPSSDKSFKYCQQLTRISTLFLLAGIQYVYITYLGYAALPFVARSELLLTPLLPIFGG
jgi:hypothetical protein